MSTRVHKQKLRSVIHKMSQLAVTPVRKPQVQIFDKIPPAPRVVRLKTTMASLQSKLRSLRRDLKERRTTLAVLWQSRAVMQTEGRDRELIACVEANIRVEQRLRAKTVKKLNTTKRQIRNIETLGS